LHCRKNGAKSLASATMASFLLSCAINAMRKVMWEFAEEEPVMPDCIHASVTWKEHSTALI
jgi:hypothetical protein